MSNMFSVFRWKVVVPLALVCLALGMVHAVILPLLVFGVLLANIFIGVKEGFFEKDCLYSEQNRFIDPRTEEISSKYITPNDWPVVLLVIFGYVLMIPAYWAAFSNFDAANLINYSLVNELFGHLRRPFAFLVCESELTIETGCMNDLVPVRSKPDLADLYQQITLLFIFFIFFINMLVISRAERKNFKIIQKKIPMGLFCILASLIFFDDGIRLAYFWTFYVGGAVAYNANIGSGEFVDFLLHGWDTLLVGPIFSGVLIVSSMMIIYSIPPMLRYAFHLLRKKNGR